MFLDLSLFQLTLKHRWAAVWHTLDSPSGQVCLNIKTMKLHKSSTRDLNEFAVVARRRISLDRQGPTIVHQIGCYWYSFICDYLIFASFLILFRYFYLETCTLSCT